jgi:hypothetical protein
MESRDNPLAYLQQVRLMLETNGRAAVFVPDSDQHGRILASQSMPGMTLKV